MGAKTVFLDRDGVINIDSSEYIKTESEFEFIPRSPEAIAFLTQKGFDVIVITNQSLIGRKMATLETLLAIFKKMTRGVEKAGGRIKDIFFCPHAPDQGCLCRKPKPGLILDAQKKHGISLDHSFMVGDSVKDIECALAAGCARTLLVKTGNGLKAQKMLLEKNITVNHIASDLFDAARWIVNTAAI